MTLIFAYMALIAMSWIILADAHHNFWSFLVSYIFSTTDLLMLFNIIISFFNFSLSSLSFASAAFRALTYWTSIFCGFLIYRLLVSNDLPLECLATVSLWLRISLWRLLWWPVSTCPPTVGTIPIDWGVFGII